MESGKQKVEAKLEEVAKLKEKLATIRTTVSHEEATANERNDKLLLATEHETMSEKSVESEQRQLNLANKNVAVTHAADAETSAARTKAEQTALVAEDKGGEASKEETEAADRLKQIKRFEQTSEIAQKQAADAFAAASDQLDESKATHKAAEAAKTKAASELGDAEHAFQTATKAADDAKMALMSSSHMKEATQLGAHAATA